MPGIVHVSDPHFGGEDRKALDVVAEYVADNKPELVIATGDLALDGRAEELRAAFEWLKSLHAPVLATPGNHDVPYHSLPGRLISPFSRFEAAAIGVDTEIWTNHRFNVVALNTARGIQFRMNWAQGAVSGHQIISAQTKLAEPPILNILATHHPLNWPVDAPITGRTWGGVKAEERLARAGFHIFLSGHLHVASARPVGVAHAISVCGGTLSQRVRHEPCAFTTLDIDAHALSIDIHHIVQGTAELAAARRFPIPWMEAEPVPGDHASTR